MFYFVEKFCFKSVLNIRKSLVNFKIHLILWNQSADREDKDKKSQRKIRWERMYEMPPFKKYKTKKMITIVDLKRFRKQNRNSRRSTTKIFK